MSAIKRPDNHFKDDEQLTAIIHSLRGLLEDEPPENPLDFMENMTLEDINNLEGIKKKK